MPAEGSVTKNFSGHFEQKNKIRRIAHFFFTLEKITPNSGLPTLINALILRKNNQM
jgi:hypothetical protein